ncbi:MAG: DNA repair protein RecN [Pseudomonadota bacterium]
MLKSLHIKNLAIIDEATLDFATGFSVLTGETGAGKSILLDALGLVLGTRADPALVRQGSDKAEISAEFDLADAPAARAWLEAQELTDEDEAQHCLIRRVVTAEGRTKAFINGQAANAAALRELGEQLVDLFGQNESQTLLKSEVQRGLLDDFGNYPKPRAAVAEAASAWLAADRAISEAKTAAGRDPAQIDYLRHQVQELRALQVQDGEIDTLEADHKRLANSGRLMDEGARAVALLYEGDAAIYDQLSSASSLLAGLTPLHAGFAEAENLAAQAQALVREAAEVVTRQLDKLDLDPAVLAEVESRLSALHDMARKHRIRANAIPEHLTALATELDGLEHAGERMVQLEREREAALKKYQDSARLLSAARSKAAKTYSEQVSLIVRQLGMANAQLVVAVEASDSERPRLHGADEVRFDFSANPGQPPRALAKVASGGELSRVSLAIQVVGAADSGAPTMIFDEVDAGIGGGVADIVGQKLKALGARRQVLCVTHLAQVAVHGAQHFGIRKEVRDAQTFTRVLPLLKDARALEVARMLGGQEITVATQALARDLLKRSA